MVETNALIHYLNKHDVVGKPLLFTMDLNPWQYDGSTYKDGKPITNMQVTRFLNPVYHPKGLAIVDAIKLNLTPEQNESERKIIGKTYIVFGGGAAGALENTGVVSRIEQAQENNTGQKNHRIANILAFGHPQGSSRTKDVPGINNINTSAEVIAQAIIENKKTYGISEQGVVLVGFSAGGALATNLIPLLEKAGIKCDGLVIIDPAGMSEQKEMTKKLVAGSIFDSYKKSRETGNTRWQSLQAMSLEIRRSWTLSDGTPNTLIKMITGMLADNRYKNWIGNAFGFGANNYFPNAGELSKDITKGSRSEIECPVILCPALFSEALNLLSPEITIKDLKIMLKSGFLNEDNKNKIFEEYSKIIENKFSKSKQPIVLEFIETMHSALLRSNDFWEKLIPTLQSLEAPVKSSDKQDT